MSLRPAPAIASEETPPPRLVPPSPPPSSPVPPDVAGGPQVEPSPLDELSDPVTGGGTITLLDPVPAGAA
jgi:hypothetical protein